MSPHADYDPAWVRWTKEQSEWTCLICGQMGEVAHLQSAKMGGGGGSDEWIMPLCHQHHMESHARPEWWYRHRVALAKWWTSLPLLRAQYAIWKKGHGN